MTISTQFLFIDKLLLLCFYSNTLMPLLTNIVVDTVLVAYYSPLRSQARVWLRVR